AELEHEAEEVRTSGRRAAIIAVAGLAAVYGGAWMLVDGGVRILSHTGLAAGFVGAAIVGALASLDEVLLDALPVIRGAPELATTCRPTSRPAPPPTPSPMLPGSCRRTGSPRSS